MQPYILFGLILRLIYAPFLLQWFHPDERQTLEFAHFIAHHRLHPFMESSIHLRNQTAPFLFSWLIRGLDSLSLQHPWAYLTGIQWMIGIWNGAGFLALLQVFQKLYPNQPKLKNTLGWFFALFWGFSALYSRPLLESLSFAPCAFLLLSVLERKTLKAGMWAGTTAFLRYPSALWALGGALTILYLSIQSEDRRTQPLFKKAILYISSFTLLFLIGGIADYFVYGKFLKSAPEYWHFNQPHGPVEKLFGNDTLIVYLRWFEYLFTPWLAPIVIVLGGISLFRNQVLLCYCLPYIIGHLWTPHREPRFMLPLTPFIFLAIFGFTGQLIQKNHLISNPTLKKVGDRIVILHFILNFLWIPLYAWGQWNSAQGLLLRNYKKFQSSQSDVFFSPDPIPIQPVDAIIPPEINWIDSKCNQHRPLPPSSDSIFIFSRSILQKCTAISDLPFFSSSNLEQTYFERIFRIRGSQLWKCSKETLKTYCPQGMHISSVGEPYFGNQLGREENGKFEH